MKIQGHCKLHGARLTGECNKIIVLIMSILPDKGNEISAHIKEVKKIVEWVQFKEKETSHVRYDGEQICRELHPGS